MKEKIDRAHKFGNREQGTSKVRQNLGTLSNVIIIRQGNRFVVKHEMWGRKEETHSNDESNNKQEKIKGEVNC